MADHTEITEALATALADGRQAVVVLVETDERHVPTALAIRSTPMSALALADVAQFVLEQAIALGRRTDDGSADAALGHLEDALASCEAASAATMSDDGPRSSPIGRA